MALAKGLDVHRPVELARLGKPGEQIFEGARVQEAREVAHERRLGCAGGPTMSMCSPASSEMSMSRTNSPLSRKRRSSACPTSRSLPARRSSSASGGGGDGDGWRALSMAGLDYSADQATNVVADVEHTGHGPGPRPRPRLRPPFIGRLGERFALGYSLPPGAPRRRYACRGITVITAHLIARSVSCTLADQSIRR